MTLIFKATEAPTESKQIVVSFSGRWKERLSSQSIQYVFRKRIPKSIEPAMMFIYVGTPVCQIIGRAKIVRFGSMSLKDALSVCDKAQISPEELKAYMAQSDQIGFYQIEPECIFNQPISLKTLSEELNFHPPQSFVHVSKTAALQLNKYR